MTEQTPDKNCTDCGCKTQQSPQKGSLVAAFAGAGGAGALGFLAAHAGCIATPVVAATLGLTTGLTAGMSVLAFAFSTAVTGGGVYVWHRLRGQKAGTLEKTIVIGSAISGLAFAGAMHLTPKAHCHAPTTQKTTFDTKEIEYCGQPSKPPAQKQKP